MPTKTPPPYADDTTETEEQPAAAAPQHGEMADALRMVMNMAAENTVPEIHDVEVPDGAGGKLTIPVVMLPTGSGGLKAEPLLDVIQQGAVLANSLRLAQAKGPDARTGTAHHQALVSFINHAVRSRAKGSVIWADPTRRELLAVLDYHEPGAEGATAWGRHRGDYPCPLSEAWKAWGGTGGLVLSQDKFVDLLDTRDRELTTGKIKDPNGNERPAPPPAELVTLAGQLETFSSNKVKRERDAAGLKLTYSHESGVAGNVKPPSSFLIKIRVFEDEEPQTLEVRLRVTVPEDGHARFALRIHCADEVLRDSFAALCQEVHERTEIPLFIGKPEEMGEASSSSSFIITPGEKR